MLSLTHERLLMPAPEPSSPPTVHLVMRRVFLLGLPLIAAACAHAAPLPRAAKVVAVAPALSAPAPVPSPLLPREVALAEARARFASAEIHEDYEIPDHAAALAAGGLDEARAGLLLRSALADCFARPEPCVSVGILPEEHASEADTADGRIVQMLVAQLGAVAGESSLELLARLHGHGVGGADDAIEQVLERRAAAAHSACAAPTTAELDTQRAALASYTVLESKGAGWQGRPPTPAEREDLAYFFAAIREAGTNVGDPAERGPSVFGTRAPESAERQALLRAMDAALGRGDLLGHARAARAYLTTLGYPGVIRGEEESDVAWGGPRYAYVMRALALSTEMLGEANESADLYRRANPGGGGCGTTVDSRRASQVRGLIRVTETARGCRPTVSERLYASNAGYRHAWYGPQRLADAGFDLARLYRGALLTRGHDAAEDWDTRVRALEGLADTAGKPAVAVALAQAKAGPVAIRIRALQVVAQLGQRSGSDPCASLAGGWFSLRHISSDERQIRSLDATCATKLSTAEQADLVRALVPLAADRAPEIREHVARTLGEIAPATAGATLTALLSDPFRLEGSTICSSTNSGPNRCRDNWPVREAAQNALDRIADLRQRSAARAGKP